MRKAPPYMRCGDSKLRQGRARVTISPSPSSQIGSQTEKTSEPQSKVCDPQKWPPLLSPPQTPRKKAIFLLLITMNGPSANTPLRREGRTRQKLDPGFPASEAEVVLAGGGRSLLYTKQMHHQLLIPGHRHSGGNAADLPTRSSENNCTHYLPSFQNRTSAEE